MSLKEQDVRRALMGKFGFVEIRGKKHERVALFINNRQVAMTAFSRSHRDIDDHLLGEIARQIGVNRTVFKRMIECTVGREEYLRLLRQRHPDRFA